jgi:CheY-like chemotaxis protein
MPDHDPSPPNQAPAGARAAESGRSIRILLVDDDPINQLVATNLLRRRGWQPASAGNGKEALELLANQRFDLILLDLQMPEMDGFQTASVIRQYEIALPAESPRETTAALRQGAAGHSGHIPIIALTTTSQPGTKEKCLSVGMDDFLNKPIIPKELYATIEKYLQIGP